MNGPHAAPGRIVVWLPKLAARGFASLRLTTLLLCLLLLLTWLGTHAQVELGIHAAQKKYFDSFYLVHDAGGVPLPLPGAQLVLWLLALNLLVGGIVRLKVRFANVGVLITHLGIVVLLAAGLVKFHHSEEGVLSFYPGESRSEFQSYHEWELAILEPLDGGAWREHLVPGAWLRETAAGGERRFTSPDLPFDVVVAEFLDNCMPRPVRSGAAPPRRAIDGFFLEPLAAEREAELNGAGVVVEVHGKGGEPVQSGLLWGYQLGPFEAVAGGRRFGFDLRKKRTALGWTIRLEEFTKSDHPGTRMPRDFRSRVTSLDAGGEETVEISMNEPLRRAGFILYQTSWGPQQAPPGTRLYSVLAVVRNPSDQWPLVACIIISCGLALHFTRKLLRYAAAQAAKPGGTTAPGGVS